MLTLVVVACDVVAFNNHITVKFHLFTSDTATINNSISYCELTHWESLNFVQSLALVSNSCIKDILSELNKVSILSNEVSFTLEGDNSTKAIFSLYKYATFSCFTIRTLSSDSLTLLADDFDSGFDIAICFCKSLLTVTKTCASHNAQLLDFFHSYCHNVVRVLKVIIQQLQLLLQSFQHEPCHHACEKPFRLRLQLQHQHAQPYVLPHLQR
ncbi:hypothetical protein EVA_13512 [gut metagenome]|uniref:Uncharacterized protein n=1 Tax=gut metagenome TaxID=749906 RepID=J9FTT6_9ZZZZ